MSEAKEKTAELERRITERIEQVRADKLIAIKQQRFEKAATLQRHETRLSMLRWRRYLNELPPPGMDRLSQLEAQVVALTQRVKELEEKVNK